LLKLEDAFIGYLQDRKRGLVAKVYYDSIADQTRSELATMLGCQQSEIAFVGNVSQGMNLLADAVKLNPGDNVVTEDAEYPSVALPWFRHKQRGIEIRMVHSSNEQQSIANLASGVDHKTRLICVSHASYLTGYRYDLEALSSLATSFNARLIVDASQTLGVVPVSAPLADVILSTGHKWLLGPHGIGIIAWNRTRWPDLEPPSVGWHSVEHTSLPLDGTYRFRESARRLEAGILPYPNIYCLRESVRYLSQITQQEIEQHVLTLGEQLIQGLKMLALDVVTPDEPRYRAGNICFLTPNDTELQKQLEDRGIQVSAGYGRIRISIHLFNDSSEIEQTLAALKSILV